MISVVIPLYNKERHIGRAVESVLNQTYRDFELIIVDDGSTDGSADVVRRFNDPRVRLVHREHVDSAGGHAARNRGIAEARADLIAFLDADDEWMPSHLETIGRLSHDFPECGAFATAYEVVDAQHRRRPRAFRGLPRAPWEGIIPNYFRAAAHCQPVCSSAVAIPKHVFDSVGRFPEGVPRGGDLDMWCRIALRYPIAFSNQVEAVYHRDAENRICEQRPIAQLLDHRLLKTIGDTLDSGVLPPGVTRDDLVEYRNGKLMGMADDLVDTGKVSRARDHLQLAASTRRSRLRWLRSWVRSFVPTRIRRHIRTLKQAGSRSGDRRSRT
jgi:glycosyltransferase involved in cell wall biosynthesis